MEMRDTSVNVRPAESIQGRSGTQHAAEYVKVQEAIGRHKDRTDISGVGHMQARPGEMRCQSRPESERDEVSAIATDGTRKQVTGRGAKTGEGDGTGCTSSTSLYRP